jgi:hypothetical protein
MKPIKFSRANKTLTPSKSEGGYSKNVIGIEPLSIWTDGEQCASCWRPSLRERLSILFFGRVWVAVLSGSTQPPIYVDGVKEYLKDA